MSNSIRSRCQSSRLRCFRHRSRLAIQCHRRRRATRKDEKLQRRLGRASQTRGGPSTGHHWTVSRKANYRGQNSMSCIGCRWKNPKEIHDRRS